MKLKYIVLFGLGLAAIQASADDKNPAAPPTLPGVPAVSPTTMPDKDKLSYAIGMNFGNNLKRNQVDVDIDAMMAAIKDVTKGGPTRFTEAEATQILSRWQMASRLKQQQEMKEKAETNKKAGDEFRAKFGKEEGAITLTNGMQYKIVKEGSGEMAKPNDTVTMSYKGTFLDGTEFDHNDSFITPVTGRTIPGWTQIMQLMKAGSKFHVVIPPDLAYGPFGQPPKIPPQATLIFDMELISIQSAPPPAPVQPKINSTTGQPQNQVVSGEIIKVPSAEELKKGAKIEVIKAEDLKDGKPK